MLSAEEKYKRYDKRTNKKMADYNRSGGSVASPVRDVSTASPSRKLTRGRFLPVSYTHLTLPTKA